VGAGAATVLLAAALVGGKLSKVTVAEHDYEAGERSSRWPRRHRLRVTPVAPAPSQDHDRPLDEPAATAMLAHLSAVLPPDATLEDNAPSTSQTVTPPAGDAANTRLAALEKAMPGTDSEHGEQHRAHPTGRKSTHNKGKASTGWSTGGPEFAGRRAHADSHWRR
jgi:hypothetical protein